MRRIRRMGGSPIPVSRARAPWLAASLAVVAAAPAGAAWLTGHDLKRHCDAFVADAESGEAAACIAFVQGFIATGRLHDGSRDATIRADRGDGFSERAARTRGGARLRAFLVELNRYCIGDVDGEEVVMRVSGYLAALGTEDANALAEPAEQVVQRALVDSFPCSGR